MLYFQPETKKQKLDRLNKLLVQAKKAKWQGLMNDIIKLIERQQ